VGRVLLAATVLREACAPRVRAAAVPTESALLDLISD
jgi:hypothetical protein